jgi:hypothetical protein
MILPSLPKLLNKREANWTTTVFRKWCENTYKKTAVFEIKYAKGDSLSFSAVKEHQMSNLLYVRHGTFVYKIPDMGEKAPFDILCLTELPSYIVIKYPKGVAIIPIDVFVLESKRSKRRSLVSKRAFELSTIEFAKHL